MAAATRSAGEATLSVKGFIMLPFLPLIGTALSGAMSLFGQSQTNSTMESMAANRYQTASADMQKAGLNPAMMFSNGGPAPMPNIQNSAAGATSAIQQGLSTAVAMKQAETQVRQADQQIAASKVSAALDAAKIPTQNATTANIKADTVNTLLKQGITAADVGSAQSRSTILRNEAKSSQNESNMPSWMRTILDQAGFAGQKLGDALGPAGSTARMLEMVP